LTGLFKRCGQPICRYFQFLLKILAAHDILQCWFFLSWRNHLRWLFINAWTLWTFTLDMRSYGESCQVPTYSNQLR
jgi:hypothetical protein